MDASVPATLGEFPDDRENEPEKEFGGDAERVQFVDMDIEGSIGFLCEIHEEEGGEYYYVEHVCRDLMGMVEDLRLLGEFILADKTDIQGTPCVPGPYSDPCRIFLLNTV